MKYLTSQIEFIRNEQEFLSSPQEETVIVVLDRTEVVYGLEGSCNVGYCEEHQIPWARQEKLSLGGCIVGVKGNIFIDAKRVNHGGECLADRFSKALRDYLISKGLDSVRCDNNDVLVEDYKVASGCEYVNEDYMYMGYQISFGQDLEVIKEVCNKDMVKVPKGLSEFGVETEDILTFIKNYWTLN